MRAILSEIILVYKRRRLTAGRQVRRLPQQKTGNEDMKGKMRENGKMRNETLWRQDKDEGMAESKGRNCKAEESVEDGWADRKAIYRSEEMIQIMLE